MSDQKPASRNRRRRLFFGLVTILVSSAISLGCHEILLKLQRQRIAHSDRLDEGLFTYDPRLGWRLTPDFVGSHQHYDFDAEYTTNRHGFRGEFNKDAGSKRYAVVGDSFTFGLGVDNHQTFVHLMNAKGRAFYNFSIPAFSTDQQYLLIKDRVRKFAPDVIVLVVYLGNDLFDIMLDFPLQSENAKPYFELDADGQLNRRNFPVPKLRKPPIAQQRSLSSVVLGADSDARPTSQSKLSAWLSKLELVRRMGLFQDQRLVSDAYFQQRFATNLQLFRALVGAIGDLASDDGADLKLVLMPGKSFLTESLSVSKQYQDFLRRRIVTELDGASGIEVIDLAAMLRDAQETEGGSWYFPNEGHLTPEGHRAVARMLKGRL